ncbi:adhesin/invasin protein PagN [Salmonella enterica]|uniref:Adhesin/invasin protein PagN n=2 Tax=Salmonella enterica subsp. arizonae TaxID=59203 RepID=A0A8F7R1U5_SALER|nr:adhesin/invasin protein PagN [Salmonella enterica]EAN8611120.1 adhesin/invasin protein PagN [Salmonella enterica subsp. arizonae serovar 48:z4,z24:-]EAO5938362.1 adhesin/invasin protein PagN [Salmonella enterica subsp. houtenae serovar 48:g,z51:-]EAW3053860.1 adhesin/invasin protein PagN [Salmonella enterica subsp. enterica]ECP3268556.1 adhesin/invasin protein PagN [Salmonella enterica subsp. enterica serovar [1],13,23:g,z51:-]EDR1779428.1 adhesin/invasin protein PagN [Salmonella enterica s
MKKFFAVCIISLLGTHVVTASAKEGGYITGKVGASVVNLYGINSTLIDDGDDVVVNGQPKLPDRTKGVFGGGVAIGYDFNDQFQLPVRLELDTTFRGETDAKGGQDFTAFDDTVHMNVKNQVRMSTYMVNGYYDFHNSTAFTPYISAGIGLARVKLKNNTMSEDFDINETLAASKNNFAWGAGIGAKYAVTDNIAIDASYKYINAGKVSISKNNYAGDEYTSYYADTKAASNDFMIGITYAF